MPRCIAMYLAALCLAVSHGIAQTTALSVNTAVREEVRQFYRAVYSASQAVPMGWSGNYETGAPGTTSSLFKEATRLRINFYRALVGVPADITFDATYNIMAQRAALLMSVNDTLSHSPDSTWKGYTPEGALAAGKSNLALGSAGPDAIDGYMADAGRSNSAVGHRRWLYYPQTLIMGTGDVPGSNTLDPANAIWVIDGRFNTPRPTTRATHVAYPPAGYVPHSLVWPRWSFSYPRADFSVATVTMKRNGVPISVVQEPVKSDIGEPTLVWIYDGQNPDSDAAHSRPAADMVYTVTISTVRIGGQLQDFLYNVTVFDPDQPSPDTAPARIIGPQNPVIGAPSRYAVITPPFVSGFEWRSAHTSPAAPIYTAERGLEGLLTRTTPGYAVVQSSTAASGTFAYRLAHLTPRADEFLQLPDTYLAEANSSITFQSRLGIATDIETARVQVSTDGGVSWIDIFRQSGTSTTADGFPLPTETGFVARTLSLGAFARRTINVRLVYSIEQSGTAFVPDATNNVGWFIDNLALTNVRHVTASVPTAVKRGNAFTHTALPEGEVNLQARGLMFGYPLEWGPVTALTPTSDGTARRTSYLSNLSVRTTAGTGTQTLIAGFNVTGGNKSILVRGLGPALVPFGVTGTLTDPKLDVFRGSARIAENDDWRSEDRPTFQALGAFELSSNSRDAALITSLSPDSYTVQVSGTSGPPGVALVELYDMGDGANGARLSNVSARSSIASGNDVLIAGFNIAGDSLRTLVIRAIGPGLSPFNVTGVLGNPRLQLYGSDQRLIAENDNWDSAIASLFEQVGAFPLPNGSHDAALFITLPPGSYTAQVTGVGNSTGVALIEVYDIP
jgi:hypothetical protein